VLLVGPEWRVVVIGGVAVAGAGPTLRLGLDGRVTGSTLDGDVFEVGDCATTRMAGPPEAMAIESRFIAALAGPLTVTDDGETVTLSAVDGSAALVLAASERETGPEAG
jgi:heat shock protein HslJ